MYVIFKNRRIWQAVLLSFAAYTILLLVNLPSVYFFNSQSQQPTEWWSLTIRTAWGFYSWALIAPAILWLGYHFPITRPNLYRNISLHLIVSILTGVVRFTVFNLGLWAIGFIGLDTFQTELSKPATLIQVVTGSIIHYPTIIAVQHAYRYFRESQERAFHLQQAELKMLKMQIHPHFFFNTLNAISALIYRSPKDADRMIIRLGDMFRIALKKDKAQEVPLKEELEFLETFLQIHKTLMGRRLQIEWRIEPETLNALVPNLILQPLAENAIQHGIAPLENGGRITICAERQNGHLLLQVSDDGHGFVLQNNGNGIGLSNVQARLENLYGNEHRFSINNSAGVSVNMEIPFREQSAEKNEH